MFPSLAGLYRHLRMRIVATRPFDRARLAALKASAGAGERCFHAPVGRTSGGPRRGPPQETVTLIVFDAFSPSA